MKYVKNIAATSALLAGMTLPAAATDLEVTHWWTSGGEAAAIAELAKAFDATGNKWVDGAIAGAGGVARPIMISRITGGDPMGATQFAIGRQSKELIDAGLMRDITSVADANHWRDFIKPMAIMDNCTVDGKIYCAPLNVHSKEWLWVSNEAFKKVGIPVPTTWDEFVATGPKLRAAGIQPLALGGQAWQADNVFDALLLSLGGPDLYMKIYKDKDAKSVASPEAAKVFAAFADVRSLSAGTNVQDWNQATNMVITAKAGAQISGDWAQGEFERAGQKSGSDYSCLLGLGVNNYISTTGDAIFFPKLKDEAKSKAQEVLAALLLDPKVQLAFNTKKGSVPIRNDVDVSGASECMQKGIKTLRDGNALPAGEQLLTSDTRSQKMDLITQFIATPTITPEELQTRFAKIIAFAD
ncbi:ABC transporter substrate-binding protein [Agrobacterium sp. T29]|uniref:ABC transporter substrate-binding protein n=1 Tax=Agrobacterium sp. T29 TaxID=2580515 RepID=UPI00115EE93E|nr:ABC transporter substrate-binding protein [Agrobacterium sp. T29]